MIKFIDEFSFDERYRTSQKVLETYPDRIPIICEPSNSPNLNITNYIKRKYLVPRDVTVGKFILSIREQIQLAPEEAMFIFVNNTLPPTSGLMGTIYDKNKSNDGFLYVLFAGENVYG